MLKWNKEQVGNESQFNVSTLIKASSEIESRNEKLKTENCNVINFGCSDTCHVYKHQT